MVPDFIMVLSFLDPAVRGTPAGDRDPGLFRQNEQKWWGNFIYTKLPTFFCGFAALIRPDFQEIAFFARSMPHKRWNLGGGISLFENTPPKMLIPGFRLGSRRRSGLRRLPFSGE
ncbi:MAG: hypothetical protein ACOYJH_04310 [Anaerovoracaceae bacterium]|jgi:hypothetical protein